MGSAKGFRDLVACAFAIALPFVDVPRWGVGGISIIAVPALILCAMWVRDGMRPKINARAWIFFAFLAVYCASYAINYERLDVRGGRHILYYALTFIIYYFATACCLNLLGVGRFRMVVFVGLLALLLVGIFEIGVFFVFGYRAYANFLGHGTNVGTFADHIPRMRSLFNEPSHLALYVASVAPIVWPLGVWARVVVIFMIFITFSTSLFIGLAVAGLVLAVYLLIISDSGRKRFGVIASMVAISALFVLNFDVVFGKFIDIQSADKIRYSSVVDSFGYLLLSPFYGLGPTFYYKYADVGLFNWYLQLYVEAGLVGLSLMLLFLSSHLKCIYRGMGVVGLFFAASVFIQYVGMNHYYLPGLWVLLSFSVVLAPEARAASRSA